MSVAVLEKYRDASVKATPNVAAFIEKWGPGGKSYKLGERAGAQAHFIELCGILDVPTPDDPDNYCFEKGFRGVASGHGFADVWMRGHFGWEYKAPKGDLGAALQQLIQYALPLENPPLLVVSDRLTFEIHTHFTGHPSVKTVLSLDDLKDPAARQMLRTVFTEPYRFRPGKTVQQLTEDVASTFALIADRMRARGVQPRRAAHFLTQCVFCFFADDAGLLPADVFKRLIQKKVTPKGLQRSLTELFEKMQAGGSFGVDDIPWFNGGLFKEIDVPELQEGDVLVLAKAASENWRFIDAAIFGTLFERGLDPSKRAQLGAHYTDTGTILRLLEPAIRRPLLAEWANIRERIAALLSKRDYIRVRAKGISSKSPALKERFGRLRTQANEAEREAKALFSSFLHRLSAFRVLDPACGSGNFLYMALKCLKDLEHLVNFQAEEMGLERQLSVTGPHNLLGIETNEFASELAKVTVWIGELQWLREHGFTVHETPILQPLDHIQTSDALLAADGALAVIARDDDYTFGVLQSRFHRVWSLRLGTSLEDRPRYTPTTCFETFPFPKGLTPADTANQKTERWEAASIPQGLPSHAKAKAGAVALAAHRLHSLRENWLNPPEWTQRVPEVVPIGMAVSPYPDRVVARVGLSLADRNALERRTLTNLYNEAPDWLQAAHTALDNAVAAAYGWEYKPGMTDEEILTCLLRENQDRAGR